jgi:hypothetical protein
MASNERQADFFERLEADVKDTSAAFGTKDVARWANLGERQARRVMVGEADLTVEMAKLIILHAPEPIADAMIDYITEGTDRLMVDTSAQAHAEDFNANIGDTLKALGDLVTKRSSDTADGQVTLAERDGELAICTRAIRMICKLKVSVANTPIGLRQKAKPPALKLVGLSDIPT